QQRELQRRRLYRHHRQRELRQANERRLSGPPVPVRRDLSILMRRIRAIVVTLAAIVAFGVVSTAQGPARVLVETELGEIVLEVDTRHAPNTAANFLRYVDAGHYNGGTFHRTVKMDNQPDSPVKIEVIQAGVNPDRAKDGFPPIAIERTNVT